MRLRVVAATVLVFLAVFGPASSAMAAFHLEYVEESAADQPALSVRPLVPTSEVRQAFARADQRWQQEQARLRATRSEGAFWTELQKCETPNGDTHPLYVGPYQFHPKTAQAAGGTDLAAAKRWAARLHAQGTSPGSTSGWPNCWWVAKRKAGYAPY